MHYENLYKSSLGDPEKFWETQARAIPWFQFPQKVLSQDAQGFYRWYAGGKLNLSYLALDYHIEQGRGKQLALIYDSPVTQKQVKFTYIQLRDEVARFAGLLKAQGLEKGDRVVIYMPMIPQAAIAMLACARLGAVHSVVFGGFAAHELAIRIDDARPKLIISASCGIEFEKVIPYKPLLDKAQEEAQFPAETCIIYQRDQYRASLEKNRDLDWEASLVGIEGTSYVELDAQDPLYILYTSGTTGKPKGILRDNGGYAVALKFSMDKVYDTKAGEVYWAASDVGWVVGHSYIVYGPLIQGCTSILFEGKPIRTPDASTFWRVMAEHRVNTFFTAPTAFRAIKKEDPKGQLKSSFDLSALKYVFLAGERCDISTYEWVKEQVGVPVIDHWWQTESGWPMLANMMGIDSFPVKPGSAGRPVCGFDIQILDEQGKEKAPREEGAVAIKLPLPPGCLPNLWQDEARFVQSYLDSYPGYYLSGDGGYKDEEGYVYITGRVDDVINVAGHRLSTAEMEEMVSSHPAVAECAVIGIADSLRGQRPIALVVLKNGLPIDPLLLENELIQKVRSELGPVAYFKNALTVKRLPKTRSGKILRKVMRKIADGESYSMPSTIDDPLILKEISENLRQQQIGLAFA